MTINIKNNPKLNIISKNNFDAKLEKKDTKVIWKDTKVPICKKNK